MTLRPRARSTGTARCDSMCGSARNTTSATLGEPLGVEIVETQLGQPAQVGIAAGQRLAGQALGGDAGQRRRGDGRAAGGAARRPCTHWRRRRRRGGGRSRHRTQRLEYWNFCRAPGWPYFFRSRMRGSRVRSPAFLSGDRSFSSKRVSARDRPWRTAPGLPGRPAAGHRRDDVELALRAGDLEAAGR